ncbi:mechanosensitive ion channel family protein [Pseudoxanthobacter sp.]|uniref:mechanosensitive ion channel family protein n=1 Tax=Pseudoxanthobacter sp. TaxID=1925742 RepID=UPI002FE24418
MVMDTPVTRTGTRAPGRFCLRLPCAGSLQTVRVLFAVLLLALGLLPLLPAGTAPALAAETAGAAAKTAPPAADTATAAPVPADVREMMRLLNEPDVRSWLTTTLGTGDKAAAGAASAAPAAASVPGSDMAARLSDRLGMLRNHAEEITAALDNWPNEAVAWTHRLLALADIVGPFRFAATLIVPFLLGAAVEALARLLFGRTRLPATALGGEADRWIGMGLWLMRRIGGLIVFSIAGIATFLLLEPPPLLEGIAAAYFTAVVIVRLAKVAVELLLAPGVQGDGNANRIMPFSDEAAGFWARRITLFIGWFAFGYATVAGLAASMSLGARKLDAYVLAIGLIVIAAEAIIRRPTTPDASPLRRRLASALGVTIAIALWCLWVAGMFPMFLTLLILTLLPFAITLVNAAVANIARRSSPDRTIPLGVMAVFVDRGIRSVLIIAAIVGIAHAWGIALGDLSDSESILTRIARSTMSAIIIYLGADLIWQLATAAIDSRLKEIETVSGDEAAVRRQQRLQTLLPILRNLLFIVVMVVAVLMELSAFGIDIAPLIAGAGVVGVAVGFGAQTVVKDIISGMFYLLDDAFRVGEYIQSGSYKGTVESFSLRSVKLRHHRGPVYTVPFGVLGAVQNMSRDWVVVKLTMRVTYDTDLEKARKLIKRIGTDMMADPELGPSFLEPLKMQGVEEFDEYGIKIRVKMMARPGEQFVIRRKALANIKKAFDENGIEFAVPRVQVAGGDGEAEAAAAQATLISQQAAASPAA